MPFSLGQSGEGLMPFSFGQVLVAALLRNLLERHEPFPDWRPADAEVDYVLVASLLKL